MVVEEIVCVFDESVETGNLLLGCRLLEGNRASLVK